MRPLIIGILLFVVWGFLSTYYYTTNIFSNQDSENMISEVADTTATLDTPTAPGKLTEQPDKAILYFDLNKAELKNPGLLQPFIDYGLNYLQTDTSSCLTIVGHTCSLGSEDYNVELGMKRALAVQGYFIENGFSTNIIQLYSKGEGEPAEDNSTEEGRMKNRRVEVFCKKNN